MVVVDTGNDRMVCWTWWACLIHCPVRCSSSRDGRQPCLVPGLHWACEWSPLQLVPYGMSFWAPCSAVWDIDISAAYRCPCDYTRCLIPSPSAQWPWWWLQSIPSGLVQFSFHHAAVSGTSWEEPLLTQPVPWARVSIFLGAYQLCPGIALDNWFLGVPYPESSPCSSALHSAVSPT